MRDLDFIPFKAIVDGEKPSTQPLLQPMEAVTDGGLSQLHDSHASVPEQMFPKGPTCLCGVPQNLAGEPARHAGRLHHFLIGGHRSPEQARQGQAAFSSNHADFDAQAIGGRPDKRDHGVNGKIGKIRLVERAAKYRAPLQMDFRQGMVQQAIVSLMESL